MDIEVIGHITKIKKLEYGLSVNVRETKCGCPSKDGKLVGAYDNTWSFVVQAEPMVKFIQNYFREGAFVKVKGYAGQTITYNEKVANIYSLTLKIQYIELFNFGDARKYGMKEKYNSKVTDNAPTDKNNFETDF